MASCRFVSRIRTDLGDMEISSGNKKLSTTHDKRRNVRWRTYVYWHENVSIVIGLSTLAIEGGGEWVWEE